jgi:hypothetical protein
VGGKRISMQARPCLMASKGASKGVSQGKLTNRRRHRWPEALPHANCHHSAPRSTGPPLARAPSTLAGPACSSRDGPQTLRRHGSRRARPQQRGSMRHKQCAARMRHETWVRRGRPDLGLQLDEAIFEGRQGQQRTVEPKDVRLYRLRGVRGHHRHLFPPVLLFLQSPLVQSSSAALHVLHTEQRWRPCPNLRLAQCRLHRIQEVRVVHRGTVLSSSDREVRQ